MLIYIPSSVKLLRRGGVTFEGELEMDNITITRVTNWLRLYREGKLDAHWQALLLEELVKNDMVTFSTEIAHGIDES